MEDILGVVLIMAGVATAFAAFTLLGMGSWWLLGGNMSVDAISFARGAGTTAITGAAIVASICGFGWLMDRQ